MRSSIVLLQLFRSIDRRMIFFGVIATFAFMQRSWPAVTAVAAALASYCLDRLNPRKMKDTIPPAPTPPSTPFIPNRTQTPIPEPAALESRLISFTDRYIDRHVCVPVNQLGQVVLPCELVYTALRFHAQRSRQQLPHLPPYMQLQFLPLQLQRFLRGGVLATAHALVTPPTSVFVHARTNSRWIDRIFVRVMSGFVARAEQTQADIRAAATARVAGKAGIHNAAMRGDVADVQDYLIADASCVNKRDRGLTPLHWPAELGNVEVVRLLLACNADIDARSNSNRTPLHFSAHFGKVEVTKLLLSCNADIDAKDNDDWTPLDDIVASDGHVDVCRALISAKTNAAARDSEEFSTTLKDALDWRKHDVFPFLRSACALE